MNEREAAALLAAQDHILILTHRRPDGDTVGCAAALCQGLRDLGKTAFVLPNEDLNALFAPYLEEYLAPPGFGPAFVVAVDIAGQGLFTAQAAPYLDKVDLCIDHHPSNEGYARALCLDVTCAACGELVFRILRHMGPVTAQIALPLYVAVATDTGCFVYGNTTPDTHRVAAALMETGIDHKGVNKRHFRTKSLKRLKLEGILIADMGLYHGGETAVVRLPLSLLTELGADEADVEDIAALVGQVEGVKNAVTLREIAPGECKISLRTVGGLNASAICVGLGGGGHVAAAGCTVFGTLDEGERAILAAIEEARRG